MADRTFRVLTAADTEPLTLDQAEAEWRRLVTEACAAYLDLPVDQVTAAMHGMRADARRARDSAFTIADRLERAEQLFHRKEPT